MYCRKRMIIKTVCYITALLTVVAGLIYMVENNHKEFSRREAARSRIFLVDGAESLEKMSVLAVALPSLSGFGLTEALGEMRLQARMAEMSLGNGGLTFSRSKQLLAFISCIEEMSADGYTASLEGATVPNAEVWEVVGRYAEAISTHALNALSRDGIGEFENALDEIFGGTELETVLFEQGYSYLAANEDFMYSSLVGDVVNENDALSIARKHLGKKACLSVKKAGGAHPVYLLGGSNISAVISVRGGHIMQLMFDTAEKGSVGVSLDDARDSALNILGEQELKDLELISEKTLDGCHVFKYAPRQLGVLCLDESITVGITSDTGRLCLYDALSYYRYHDYAFSLPDKMKGTEEIMNMYSLSSPPELCKIERAYGVGAVCYRIDVGDETLFADAVSGKLIYK